jgi:hypothetical protein
MSDTREPIPECTKCGGTGEVADIIPCGDEVGIPCTWCDGTGYAIPPDNAPVGGDFSYANDEI